MHNDNTKLDLLNPDVSLPLDGGGDTLMVSSPLTGEAKVGVDKATILESDTAFRLLKDIEANPSVTQRHLAAKHDISLGKTNYILNALIEKGIIKAQNFKNSKNKSAYMYVFTAEGIKIRAELARNFVQRKMREFECLKQEIEQLQREIT